LVSIVSSHSLTDWSFIRIQKISDIVSSSESYVKELKDDGYPIPTGVAILLADARSLEKNRQIKRMANRKAAYTSRARKKAEIDRLMSDNARLRRQGIILSCIPDPVIVISSRGTITFCNAQVERVLKHKITELKGANIGDLMIPRSRGVIKKLIRTMLAADQESESSESSDCNSATAKKRLKVSSGKGSDRSDIASKITSKPDFPPLEVKLDAEDVDTSEDVSDSDENRRIASLGRKNSSFNSNEGDDTTSDVAEKDEKMIAGGNLSKNVEACKLNKDKARIEQVRFSHKDDVMGASVTANNADAKLSSLMHEPLLKVKHVMGPKLTADKQEEQSSSTMDSFMKTSDGKAQAKEGTSSEDSGYRESGESPEGSNSSSSGASEFYERTWKETGKRARPMAPSRYVCVIRSDLRTIWCELTSSIRTNVTQDVERSVVSREGSVKEKPDELEKELLLCLRPIQEGEKASPDLRFRGVSEKKRSECCDGSNPKLPGVTESSGSGSG
jgi:hypothetical protein